jgi:rod shape determining protein RodA
MFDLNALRQLDWLLVVAMVAIVVIGVVVISSAAHRLHEQYGADYAKKQLIFAAMGLVVFAFLSCFDYHWFRKASPWLYGGALALLVLVLVAGQGAGGARRWFRLPMGFAMQPSEFMKLGCIFILAYLLDRYRDHWANVLYTLVPLVLLLVPMALIVKQPDLGTALAMLPVLFGLLFVAGARKRYVLVVILVGVLAVPALWLKMEPYQKKRVLEFLTVPQRRVALRLMTASDRAKLADRLRRELDPGGEKSLDELIEAIGGGWNSEQSKIAVGSGSLYGLGWRQGKQTQLRFLPAAHTDFIFPVLGEEWGFFGCLLVLALYFVLLERGLRIAAQAVDTFGRLLASGIVVLLASHIVINVAMAIGLLPITGLPLPLLSYGGSSLLMTMGSVGILQSVHTRRHYFKSGKYTLNIQSG